MMSPLRKVLIGINAVYFGVYIPDINVGVNIRINSKIERIFSPVLQGGDTVEK